MRRAKKIISSTGELALDYGRGLLKVDAPCVQGFVGDSGDGTSLEGFRPDVEGGPEEPLGRRFGNQPR